MQVPCQHDYHIARLLLETNTFLINTSVDFGQGTVMQLFRGVAIPGPPDLRRPLSAVL